MWEWLVETSRESTIKLWGICTALTPEVLVIHISSDLVIGLSFFAISTFLVRIVLSRRDIEFGWVFWTFAAFIWISGLAHFMDIWTVFWPDFLMEGMLKIVTACAALFTAVMIWPLFPKIMSIPSPKALQRAMARLREETDERLAAEMKLRQAQKLEAIGQLTSGLAHDFNNLLQVVSGQTELLQQRLRDDADPRSVRSLESIAAAASRATKLTGQLLAFSRKQSLNATCADLNELVSRSRELVGTTVGENITINFELDDSLSRVKVDTNQFEVALLNLLINARDAMPYGGEIIISTQNVELAAVESGAGGHYVNVSVRDTGHGIPEDILSRVRDPFFTTKEVEKGSGLGLSQVDGFVRQSGGHVEITSQPGAWTNVSMFFPVAGA